jgi:23S rRNA (uracil1939-C5)-methyltransferase
MHRPPCPGCPRFGAGLSADHPELAALSELARGAGIALELDATGPVLGYRQRARLAVRGRMDAPQIGIFEQGTHRALHIPRCLVHNPLVNEVSTTLAEALRELRVPPYADATHRGVVRYVQVVVERATRSAQVVLVVNGTEHEGLDPLLAQLSERLGPRLHSLFLSDHRARSNAILGPRCELVQGPAAVRESIAGASVFFPPDAFGQSNLGLYERIVERIGAMVPDGSDVLETYAGTGPIGLSLLPRVARVRFNESAAGSLAGLAMGVEALSAELRARCELHPGPVAQHVALASSQDSDIVIADPPRKGLDPELLRVLCARPPQRFVYLSCGLPALLRDAQALLAGGALQLRELIAYDLFPFTAHVETLARFDRVE